MRFSPKAFELWQWATLELHAGRDLPTLRRSLRAILPRLVSAAPGVMDRLGPHLELARRNARRRALAQERRRWVAPNGSLTPRETEIARWLAAGKTNADIAFILQSRKRTVEKHVESILRKLAVENRAAAAVLLTTDPDCHPVGLPLSGSTMRPAARRTA